MHCVSLYTCRQIEGSLPGGFESLQSVGVTRLPCVDKPRVVSKRRTEGSYGYAVGGHDILIGRIWSEV